MTQTPYPYDDRARRHFYNPTVLEAEDLCYSEATHPHLLRPTTAYPDEARIYDHFQPPVPPIASHQGGLNTPPQLTYPPHSFLPAGSGPLGATPTGFWDFDFPQSPEIYGSWELFYHAHNLFPNSTYSVPPPAYFTPGPTLCSGVSSLQYPWSTWNTQATPADGPPASNNHYPPAFSPPRAPNLDASFPPNLHLHSTLEPDNRALETPASYPCRWMEDGVICDIMVQATRCHMNRHLHACHGFSGPDTQLTKCLWGGCEETMQQGSIARHMITCHLQAKVTCSMCSKKLSRQDVISKHQRVCPAAAARRRA